MKLVSLIEELPNSSLKLYCDLDGVLVDFEKGYRDLTGLSSTEEEKDPVKFWEPINKAGVSFWVRLKWLEDGKKLWNHIKEYKPILLSAPSRDKSSEIGKRIWRNQNLPGVPLILCPSHLKQQYATPNSILIDDKKSNVEGWNQVGGIGILYTDFTSTLEKLKQVGL